MDPAPILGTALQQAGLTTVELWTRAVGLGGNATLAEVESFVSGATRPDRRQYDRLVQALNDRFIEMDLDSPVPCWDELGEGDQPER